MAHRFLDAKQINECYRAMVERTGTASCGRVIEELNLRHPYTGKPISRQAVRYAMASTMEGRALLSEVRKNFWKGVRDNPDDHILVAEEAEYFRKLGVVGKEIPRNALNLENARKKIIYGDVPVSIGAVAKRVVLWDGNPDSKLIAYRQVYDSSVA